MKKFSYLFIVVSVFVFIYGCNKKVDTMAKEPKWDRDICARCAMQVSDPVHSAQIIDTVSGDRYFFDDIGCAVLWPQENQFAWSKDAIIYFNDSLDGSWIKSNEAVLAYEFVTPMSFGVAAFRSKNSVPKDKTVVTYDEAAKRFSDIKKERMQKKHSPDRNMAQDNKTGGMN